MILRSLCILALGLASISALGAEILHHRASVELREAARAKATFPDKTQAAVDKALKYIASEQNKDGSWGEARQIETTSLALLAYLGNGASPLTEEHGEAITSAIIYLVDRCSKQRGRLADRRGKTFAHTWPLEHALATQALAESYLVCTKLGIHLPGLKDQVTHAAQFIIDGQTSSGGWAFSFAEKSQRGAEIDLSTALLHALWLTHQAGIETRNMKPVVARALAAIARRQIDTGEVQNHTFPATGAAAFAYLIAQRGQRDVAQDAVQFVSKKPDYRYRGVLNDSSLLTLLYDALAMHHLRGADAKKWFSQRTAEVLKEQHGSGQFNPQLDKLAVHPVQRTVHRTALSCLFLETPWRYHLADPRAKLEAEFFRLERQN